MALRLMETTLPEQYSKEMLTLLSQHNIFDYWMTCGCESNNIFKIILRVEETEAIINALEQRYSHLEQFRLILLPLEATIPSPRDIEKKDRNNEEDGRTGTDNKPPLRVSRQELYNEIFYGANLTNVFLTMVFLSSVVAAKLA